MNYSIGRIDHSRLRITRPDFPTKILTNTASSGIAWWNKNDHNEPYPWNFGPTYATGLGAKQFYTELHDQYFENLLNDLRFEETYHWLNGDVPPSHSFDLWAVDAAGADLFKLGNLGVSVARAATIHGIYAKQVLTLVAPSTGTVKRNLTNFYIVWQFADSLGNPIAPR